MSTQLTDRNFGLFFWKNQENSRLIDLIIIILRLRLRTFNFFHPNSTYFSNLHNNWKLQYTHNGYIYVAMKLISYWFFLSEKICSIRLTPELTCQIDVVQFLNTVVWAKFQFSMIGRKEKIVCYVILCRRWEKWWKIYHYFHVTLHRILS